MIVKEIATSQKYLDENYRSRCLFYYPLHCTVVGEKALAPRSLCLQLTASPTSPLILYFMKLSDREL